MTLFTVSRPAIKMKAVMRFPALVTADTGLAVTIANGQYTFGFNFTGLTQNTNLATPSDWWTLVYNQSTDSYEQVRLDALVDYTIDTRRGIGDTNATLLSTDRYVELTAALTAARVWTLPAANSVTGGVHIIVQDAAGGIAGANTLTVQRAGADTINGATSLILESAYDGAIFYSDGVSKWTFLRRSSEITVASGKTVTFNNTLTFSGTDGSTVAFGAGGTVAYVSNKLSAFAATTSAELAGVISDETGSGALVFGTSPTISTPTLVAPALGTPASGTLTNCSGLPISTGVSGLGTSVATALAVNVGSAGAFVVLNGALGTPSSGTLTSCTGLPISTGVSGLGTGVATALGNNLNAASGLVGFSGTLGTAAATKITFDAGTSSVAPIVLTSGTNLTTATAGSIEYNGTTALFTPLGTQRGVLPAAQTFRLNANLARTDTTSDQSIFGVGVTLTASTVYRFRMVIAFTRSGGATTSHNFQLGFGGTATLNNVFYTGDIAVNGTAYTSGYFGSVTADVFSANTAAKTTVATVGSVASSLAISVEGTVSINAAGTFIPEFKLSATNSAAYSTLACSFFEIWPIGAAGSDVSVGNWA